MKRKRNNPVQIIRKLRTAEQLLNQCQANADVCRALVDEVPLIIIARKVVTPVN